MSAFCIFGVSRLDCKKAAERKVRTVDPTTKKRLSHDEWRAEVEVLSASIFEEKKTLRQISPAFDAPQFCYDWIRIASGGGGKSGCHA